MIQMRPLRTFVASAASFCFAHVCLATPFSDDFTGGPDAQWGNENGDWFASGGVYQAQNPENFPSTYSSLPFEYSDLVFSTKINNVSDGGIWVHSNYTGSGAVGVEGVLLVTLGTQLYWHVATQSSYGASLNTANVGSYTNLTIVVSGDTYEAYVDGAATPATTLVSDTYTSGRVAVYTNSSQSFDDVSVVPEPASLGPVACGALTLMRRRRMR